MVVQAAGQDPGGVRDLAHGRGAVALLREELAQASTTRWARRSERVDPSAVTLPSGPGPPGWFRALAWPSLVVFTPVIIAGPLPPP